MPAAWESCCAAVAKQPDGGREESRALALTEELGAQLARLKGAGPKLTQFLSVLQFDRGDGDGEPLALGALPGGARAVPFGRVKRVIEHDLDDRLGELFAAFDEAPFAIASLGQVHRARTTDGDEVAVKVQHPGVAEAVESDLRSFGVVGLILNRLAPGLDAGAMLDEIRERISDELDYEVEAQHQRRLERRFRRHPHVRVPRVHTGLSARRVLVTEYIGGLGAVEIERLGDAERDRIGEIAFRFYLGLAWRDGAVAGDPHPDNCILCPDGRLSLLDFGLLRDLDAEYRRGESEITRALTAADAQGVHAGLSTLGYLPDPDAFDPGALLEHLGTAGEWMIAPGFRRVDPEYVGRIRELGYPPRSPHFATMRRMRMPPPTLLLRRMELQVLALLGELRAGADWGAITAEHHSGKAASTALGREDHAFFAGRRGG
jgi:predicted unusual protein kinase regulating ubiquinone biosynthesis (AarF/ABC1/UbiB family)